MLDPYNHSPIKLQVPYTSKPWAYLCQHPWKATFFAALDTTPWHGWRPPRRQVADAYAEEVRSLLAKVAAEHADFNAEQCRKEIVQRLMH